MRRLSFLGLILLAAPAAAQQGDTYSVGVARIDITPDYPVRLSGFGFRRAESEGVTHRIGARALAVNDDKGEPAVVLAVDNLGVPIGLVREVAARLERKAGLKPERLAVTTTHTHTAPMLTGVAPTLFGQPIPADHQKRIDRYTAELTDALEKVALAALKDRQSAKISYGVGKVAFAINRRTKGGPVDHDLPTLVVRDLKGKVRAVWVTYACHCVTLSDNKISGDWAGFAAELIEADHPGAVALVSVGCGADSNPSSGVTGDKADVARGQGASLAREARRVAGAALAPVSGKVEVRWKTLELPLDKLPTREEWEKKATRMDAIGHHARVNLARLDRREELKTKIDYPIQVLNFGASLAVAFLPGEVVVDYALRLKKELDGARLWICAYSNDAPCYIPSERILKEGGYEGGGAMVYYDLPTRLAPGLEDKIVGAVRELAGEKFKPHFDPKKVQVRPLSPHQSLAEIRTRPEMRVELVAAEPLVTSPVAIAFGPDGRLWVCEMYDYPSGASGGGRIKVLEDTDGDGKFDKATVFLDNIPFPTGVTVWRKGVLVCAAPDILHAEDTDGDGKADRVRKLFSGFGTENFQARVNSLEYGLDGWVYGSCGLFGGKITNFQGKTFALGDRDFRIKPDTGELEPATGRTQQGRVRDDWGNWFGCDNSNLCRHYPLADHSLRRNPHVAPPPAFVNVPAGPDPNKLYPLRSDLQLFKLSGPPGRTTAACGLGIYRDDLLGKEMTGNAFVCEPVNLLVHRRVLTPRGSTFVGKRAQGEETSEFLASTDPWFRPVQVTTGPDGALWVVDMYRYVIEHPKWIPPEELAKVDLRAGSTMGRIYRVVPKDGAARSWARLDKLDTEGLVKALDSPNGWQRDMASQMLVWLERNEGSATGDVSAVARQILDDKLPAKERQALVERHLDQAAELLGAMVSDLKPGTKEEYRRIPWLWRVSVAAGKQNDAAVVRKMLDVSLPKEGEPLRDWQAVVLGGGVVNGISLKGAWPGRRLDELMKDDKGLKSRWARALELAYAMADDARVPHGTRYDALRMIALDRWERCREPLTKYLAKGAHAELQMGAVSGVGDAEASEAGQLLVKHLGGLTPGNRKLALDALLRTQERVGLLLDALEGGVVERSALSAEQVRALRDDADAGFRARARKLLP